MPQTSSGDSNQTDMQLCHSQMHPPSNYLPSWISTGTRGIRNYDAKDFSTKHACYKTSSHRHGVPRLRDVDHDVLEGEGACSDATLLPWLYRDARLIC